MPLALENISSAQLLLLPRDRTVFFLPVGPLEDHGPHLPLGLDGLEAKRLSNLAAERMEKEMPGWIGVIMPHAPLGIDSNTTSLAFTVRPHVLRDWLVDICKPLAHSGFCYFVCFSGHSGPKQLTAIEEAGYIIQQKFRRNWITRLSGMQLRSPALLSANSALTSGKDFWLSTLWSDPVEHGGQRDTAVALALAPSQVDSMYHSLPENPRQPSRWSRLYRRLRKTLAGYWGSPGKATAQNGESILLAQINDLFPKLRSVWEGSVNPRKLFRSWYSLLPTNRTFFRAWLMFGILLLLAGFWIYLEGYMLY